MNSRGAILLLLLATAPCIVGQQNIDTGCPVQQKIQPDGSMKLVDCRGNVISQGPVPAPTPATQAHGPSPEVKLPADSPAAVAYQKYLAAYYDYQTHSLAYAESVFSWQYASSIVIFILVILLVITGLVFAGIQFAIAMKAHPHASLAKKTEVKVADQSTATAELAGQLELSPHGIKITSSVIGLLILVVSIGFFYLYLVYVYPIQNIGK